ncbi:hypothetical protein Vadar_018054 [Vaccinium darrowii]|uniref:Uncharacterized protein n=1 Tax=Vaccinium darrowii TaxID=229202 RepID=A0ACB7XS03_9ERIC|nr:hypothetical protein Vadar_018054 [Vaccinium darrowii]
MCSPEIVLEKIVENIVGTVFQSVGRHVGFLFHYKKNLKNLKDEMENLEGQKTVVEGKVSQAKHRSEAIDDNVLVWLKHVDETKQGVDKFMDDKIEKENMMCFKFSCPNLISRYCLSKQAEEKVIRVKRLTTEGGNISKVSHPKENPRELEFPSSKDYEDFHSRQKVFKGIVQALKDSKVNMIGVYGTGGIGIPITDEKKSCKVVLTSRSPDVWKDMDVHKDFTIEILSQEEAWALFKKKVGDYVDSPGQPLLREIARAVCKECQGLPVAINALGVALKGKDMNAWQDALDKLNNNMLKEIEGINPKLYTSLKLSYDCLDSEDAKSCFLLCCLFPEDAEIQIDDLVRYYYTAGRILPHNQMPDTLEKALYRVRTVVGTLKRCGLLLDGNGEFLVKMHDVVRDVAISIAAKHEKSFLVKHGFQEWPEEPAYEHCSIISLRPDHVSDFPDMLVCPELHTLRLDCSGHKFRRTKIPDNFFSRTEKLMVLDLNTVIMSPLLPASFAKLAKLQMLCLNKCVLGDIAILKDLKDHLEILSLRGSVIKVLPPEVGELTGLRLLDMEDCYSLKMIPKGVISKLIRLEELYMPLSFDQWEGTGDERKISNVSLDELTSLTRLTTLHIWIPDTTLLPKDLTFQNLVRFRIKFGQDKFDYRDQGFRIRYSYSEGLLKLENFHSANTLEFLLGKPKWSIQINGLHPSKFINHLTDLSVKDCGIKYLFSPSCARGLVRLQYLAIQNCTEMEGVIGTEGDKEEDILIIFSGLKSLYLDNLPNLISFYPKMEKTTRRSGSSSGHAQTVLFNDKATFPALESLEIQSVEKITEIWDKQMLPIQEIPTESPFYELSKLEINACNNLMNVVGGWPKLEAIGTEKQKGKEVDDYHVTRFPKLKIMRLTDLQNLESFCSRSTRCEVLPLFDHQVEFPVLEVLNISSLPNITDIWDKKLHPTESFCPLLRKLYVIGCDKLVNVVRSNMLPQLGNLEIHSLSSCTSMEVIVDLEKREEEAQEAANNNTIIPFPELTEMWLARLQNIKSFCIFRSGEQPVFNAQIAFPKLENLYLPSLGERALQQLLGAFELPSLKHLCLYKCDEVSTMSSPHFLRSLRNVVLLEVTYCKGVREVFNFDGLEIGDGQECVGRPSLVQVRMVQLEKLRLNLQNLEYINIKGCPLLANLFTASVAKALGGLKGLCLSYCFRMEEVITTDEEGHKDVIDDDDEIVFPKLERLILEFLPNLKSFCGSNHNLNFPSLRRVVLKNCPKVQTFTSGSVRMPQIRLTTSGSDGLVIEDLNKRLEQQHLKGDKEIIWGISEMDGGYDSYYYNLQHLHRGGSPFSRLEISFQQELDHIIIVYEQIYECVAETSISLPNSYDKLLRQQELDHILIVSEFIVNLLYGGVADKFSLSGITFAVE